MCKYYHKVDDFPLDSIPEKGLAASLQQETFSLAEKLVLELSCMTLFFTPPK